MYYYIVVKDVKSIMFPEAVLCTSLFLKRIETAETETHRILYYYCKYLKRIEIEMARIQENTPTPGLLILIRVAWLKIEETRMEDDSGLCCCCCCSVDC